MRRFLGPIIISLLVITGLIVLIRTNPTAREVAGEGFWMLFTFFSTPFILESTVAIIGLMIVVTWNQWRIRKEGDGWVEMEVPTKPADESSEHKP